MDKIKKRESQAILVLGMHRSGTSALSGALHHAGINFGSKEYLFAADKNVNAKGYWENKTITMQNNSLLLEAGSAWDDFRKVDLTDVDKEKISIIETTIKQALCSEYADSQIIGIKDPRICRIIPFWIKMLKELGFSVKFIITYRNPGEVCNSLCKRDEMQKEKAFLVWLSYTLDSEEYTRGLPRTFVSYEGLLQDWEKEFLRIEKEIDIKLNFENAKNRVPEFLTNDLRHHINEGQTIENEWVNDAYASLGKYSNGDTSEVISDQWDELRKNYWDAIQNLSPLIYASGSNSDEMLTLRKKLFQVTQDHQAFVNSFKNQNVTFFGTVLFFLYRVKNKLKKILRSE